MLIGHDVRLESPELSEALARGLMEAGADVIDIGLCGTAEVYFGTVHHGTDGGIMITASHNPKGWNGMKLMGRGSVPISDESGAPLSSLVEERIAAYPCSGEINFTIDRILAAYGGGENDHTDGVSVEFPDWRFNLRGSNTEPVLRLNVETRGNSERLRSLTEELSQLIREPVA